LGRRQLDRPITFAGIQSIYRHALKLPPVDMLLVDEAHTIPKKGTGMWRQFISELKLNNPHVKAVGFTATPYRMDSGMLHTGENALFTDIAYEVNLVDMVKDGYLTELVTVPTETRLDVTGVHMRGGEFVESELQQAVNLDHVTRAAVAEILRHGRDRGSWIVFCSGVAHAENVAAAIRSAGVSCESVSGDTPQAQRDSILRRFKAGELRAVSNNNVLTTGFDAPGIDLIACLRPTGSPGLWVQMLGRGMRLASGKEDCLVLDFAMNTDRHGHIDRIRPERSPKDKDAGAGEAPKKQCPQCDAELHASVRVCHVCGHCFPKGDAKIAPEASRGALLSYQEKPKPLEVKRVLYHRHVKEGKPDSMRVEYQCGLSRHSEWVCFEHSGFPREAAARWWSRRSPGTRTPNTVAEALQLAPHLPVPSAILVKQAGRYSEIVGHDFEPSEPGLKAG
jgi:DNA repair protein RadD